MNFKRRLLSTNNTWSLTLLRSFLGIVIFPHGAQKLFGWFGGHGPTGFLQGFEQMSGLPGFLGWFMIIIEFVGSICLILGFWTRIWAFGMICLFIGIVLTVHLPYGFFMNWGGNQAGEGYEYHLLVIGMAWALTVGGAGKLSVDRAMADQERTF
ncbi:putative oxidoreductase [Pontibacter ummariensis]|uniref:Putative oxidoreductase n=1 Tax=Pontibacter ummariensis TaxID=1610492 RepID=A0A239CA94_9BACT|nr:DoxX family protein [Pontibacter ummariensis]PRY15386.1 putative oxidoreductase [Pontibacter ummariensis]SNS16551.1 putative oxidoreductase [Pontibacter ummariensis]